MNAADNSGIKVTVEKGVQVIKFDNKKTKNALKTIGYSKIVKALKDAANDDNIKCSVLTGEGEYYCSGFDIKEMSEGMNDDVPFEDRLTERLQKLSDFITSLIDYPKLLIAVVNGPAIGISVTTLGLCDIIYASDRATFTTPFAKLALCPEGCSSYTFPLILGMSKACEMLYTNHTMSAKEANQFNLVSTVLPHENLYTIWEKIQNFTLLPTASILMSKKMVRENYIDKLHQVNRTEMTNLKKCFTSEEFLNNVIAFMSRKSKL